MGINWDDIWGQAEAAVQQGFNDLQTVGVPALQNAAEQWGISVLQEQNKETSATLKEVTKEVLNRPSAEGTFGSFLAEGFQAPVLDKYGPHILIGAVALVVVGIIVSRG